jgi:RNA polymerase sigma factor (TIGR02999 family)
LHVPSDPHSDEAGEKLPCGPRNFPRFGSDRPEEPVLKDRKGIGGLGRKLHCCSPLRTIVEAKLRLEGAGCEGSRLFPRDLFSRDAGKRLSLVVRYPLLTPLVPFRRQMGDASSSNVTELLRAWGNGDQTALEQLTPLVYEELHRIARYHMSRESEGHTLQTTALINEVYLRLVDFHDVRWQDRAHFFAVSAQLMRRILVDFARSRGRGKRGAGAVHLSLEEAPALSRQPDRDLVALDEALKTLASVDERKSKVVELRFFGGLSVEETAEVLSVSAHTVSRDWKFAKVWLLRELRGEMCSGE